MSADQALTRAQERKNSKIDRAIEAGTVARLQKNMNVTIKVFTGASIRLVSADGTVSPEGRHYYSKLGVEPPSIFPYEQGLEMGKWIKGFDGKKKMVRRMGSDGTWRPTKIGIQYFKYNRDEYQIEYPTRKARPIGKKKGVREQWQFDRDTFEYETGGVPMTVGQMKGLSLLATDADKEAHARAAAQTWIETRQTISVIDPSTGEEAEYHIVKYDSPCYYVWDPTSPIRITSVRRNIYDRSKPSSDEILQRPLRNFFVIPDGCYRPWDLHPLSLVKSGRCAVTMLHESFTKRGAEVKIWEDGRPKWKLGYQRRMTEEQIEAELDSIFLKLEYSADEYPFEKGWREDGCTSKMILEFCKRHNIACHIYHDTVRKGNELDCYVPATPRDQVNFFIRDDHCFWYGKSVEERGTSNASEANNGISQMWDMDASHEPQSDDEDVDMEEHFAQFRDKETMAFFRKADATPPFSEWQHAQVLLDAAPEFDSFQKPPKELRAHGRRVKLYFWDANLSLLEPWLRKKLQPGQVECKYGPSPDKPTCLIVNAKACPLFVIRQVPVDCELYQAIFDKAVEILKLEKGRQLVYRGESASQVAERLRLEVSRPRRHKWTDKERQIILARQNNRCECGAELEHASGQSVPEYEIDHIVRLCDGGVDTVANAEAKCVTCHAQKSEIERLGAVYRNPLESHLSIQTLEGFLDAPKSQQIVVGDGAEDCVKVDAIRCRSNALIRNNCPLPVASITDEIVQYDPELGAHEPYDFSVTADFYYIDAGEPWRSRISAMLKEARWINRM